MKFHSSLTYILGSALFISHMALGLQLGAASYEQCPTALTTEKEVQAYLEQAEANIRNTIERILSISQEKQTIENTLHPLQKLLTETSSTLMTLKHLGQTESPLQPITSQSFLYLLNLSIKTFQIPELRHAEDQVLACFLEKSQDSYTYLPGTAEEKNHAEGSYTILHLNSQALSQNALFFEELIETIRSSNADLICIQDVFSENTADALYEKLKSLYAHFYLDIEVRDFDFSSGRPFGFLIASKYPIENPQFPMFLTRDFLLNTTQPLNTNHSLILHYCPADLGNLTENTYISSISTAYSGVLITVDMQNSYYNTHFLKNKGIVYKGDNSMILCKNSAGGSAQQDSDGNASAEAHASHTEKDTRGNSTSFSVKGEVKKDKDGTVKAEAKVSYEREF